MKICSSPRARSKPEHAGSRRYGPTPLCCTLLHSVAVRVSAPFAKPALRSPGESLGALGGSRERWGNHARRAGKSSCDLVVKRAAGLHTPRALRHACHGRRLQLEGYVLSILALLFIVILGEGLLVAGSGFLSDENDKLIQARGTASKEYLLQESTHAHAARTAGCCPPRIHAHRRDFPHRLLWIWLLENSGQ